jgi:CelD/BcsL family acetyltransferase involved in cellulose biosynthesis
LTLGALRTDAEADRVQFLGRRCAPPAAGGRRRQTAFGDLMSPALLARGAGAGACAATVHAVLDDALALGLWRGSANPSVFNHPAWWRSAIEAFGAGRRLRTVTVHRDGRLAGYWPFWEKRLEARDGLARLIEPVGSRLTDYVEPLVAEGEAMSSVAAAALSALRPALGLHTLIFWPKCPDVVGARAAVGSVFGAGPLVYQQPMPTAWMVLGPTHEATQARWKPHHRREMGRQERRLGREGAVSLEVAADRAEMRRLLAILVELHRAGWTARGGRSELEDPRMVRFLEGIVDRLPEERLHLSALRVGGRIASVQIGFRETRALMLYKPAFDQVYAAFSPGKVHDALLARWSLEQGLERLDFLQGLEEYKLAWGSETRETVAFAVAGLAGAPALAWNAHWRRLAIRYRE